MWATMMWVECASRWHRSGETRKSTAARSCAAQPTEAVLTADAGGTKGAQVDGIGVQGVTH